MTVFLMIKADGIKLKAMMTFQEVKGMIPLSAYKNLKYLKMI